MYFSLACDYTYSISDISFITEKEVAVGKMVFPVEGVLCSYVGAHRSSALSIELLDLLIPLVYQV